MTDETPNTNTLKKCFWYLSKRYNWEFGFRTEAYRGDLMIPFPARKGNRLPVSKGLKVCFSGRTKVGSHEFIFDYRSLRRGEFSSIHDAIDCIRAMYGNWNHVAARSGILHPHEINSEFDRLVCLEKTSKYEVLRVGLRRLYSVLTDDWSFVLSSPIPVLCGDKVFDLRFSGVYFPSPLPKFKTLEELIIRLDLMDFKPETYTFRIPRS